MKSIERFPVQVFGPNRVNLLVLFAQRKHSCTKGDDKREFEIVKKGEGCTLNYTQSGLTRGAATAAIGLTQCERSQGNMIAKLKRSGFKCQ